MRNTIAYVATFSFAFLLVTASFFILNEKYTNMYRFDFSPRYGEAALADSLRKMHDSLAVSVNVDSVQKVHQDSLIAKAAIQDSLKLANPTTNGHESLTEAEPQKQHNNVQLAENKPVGTKGVRANDSSYVKWKRATLGIFETMDSKQIARLIVGYSDDVARDLIYSMKKKKAGEVLSLLSPEMSQRLMRVQ